MFIELTLKLQLRRIWYLLLLFPAAEHPHRNHLKDFNYSQARNNSLKTNWRLLPLLLHNNLARMWLDGQLSRPSRRWSWPHPAEPLMMCTMVDDCDCAIADAPSPPRRSAVSWLKWDGWMGRLDTWLAGWPGWHTEFKWRAASQDWLMAMEAARRHCVDWLFFHVNRATN